MITGRLSLGYQKKKIGIGIIYFSLKNNVQFPHFFRQEETLVSSNEYKKQDWRLFITSSKTNLKIVLLYNENIYSSLSVVHSVDINKNPNALLQKIYYIAHWMRCGDIKVVFMLHGRERYFQSFHVLYMGQQNNGSILVLKLQPVRETLTPDEKNNLHKIYQTPKRFLYHEYT